MLLETHARVQSSLDGYIGRFFHACIGYSRLFHFLGVN